MSKNHIITLGCRLNTFESSAIKQSIDKIGAENIVVINTCTVTSEANRQNRQAIRKARKDFPNAKIVVTGCAAQINPHEFSKMPEVDMVLGNKEKTNIENYINGKDKVVVSELTAESRPTKIVDGLENRTRAFVQIQQGCDHRCTFCIIHVARGPNVAFSKEHIVEQVKTMVDKGHNEIVLTGVDISSYDRPLFVNQEPNLGKLCEYILKEVKGLKRLRLSSLDPAVKDKTLLNLIKNEEKMMPHVHLSLQAMSDMVLRNMGRRHNVEIAEDFINELRETRAEMCIGADIIAGFPRESEEQFLETYENLKRIFVPYIHVFPFSIRENTPAAKMKQVPSQIIKERAKKIREIATIMKKSYLMAQIGTKQNILIEKNQRGYTPSYAPVLLPEGLEIGTEVIVKLTGLSDDGSLIGQLN